MTDKEFVLLYFPKAFAFRKGVKLEIRRPREREDGPALVKYILLSGIAYTEETAWGEAAARLRRTCEAAIHRNSNDGRTSSP